MSANNGTGPLRQVLDRAIDQSALADSQASLSDYTVLSPQNDPYRLDLPDNHRNGAWFAEVVERPNSGSHYYPGGDEFER